MISAVALGELAPGVPLPAFCDELKLPTALGLISPWTDLTAALPSYKTRAWDDTASTGDPVFSDGDAEKEIRECREGNESYGGADLADARISPVFMRAGSIAKLSSTNTDGRGRRRGDAVRLSGARRARMRSTGAPCRDGLCGACAARLPCGFIVGCGTSSPCIRKPASKSHASCGPLRRETSGVPSHLPSWPCRTSATGAISMIHSCAAEEAPTAYPASSAVYTHCGASSSQYL